MNKNCIEGVAEQSERADYREALVIKAAEGKSPTEIQRALGVSRPTIYKCIDKALAAGVATGLRDRFHRPHAPQISEAAKAFVIDLACRKPADLGLAAELWTLSALAQHVAAHATAAGFLRHIRVASLDELKTRILKGIDVLAPIQN